ncbi:MAG: hypothetical protein HYV14_02750 [Elusimicrobia bacterium]|nr:hypothetical protein [Elusimicrobiota bacterium]
MIDTQKPSRRKHGRRTPPIACRHIVRAVQAMSDRRIGFHATRSPDLETAWCSACDKALAAAGGRWTEAVLTRAGFAEVCPCCFEFARFDTAYGPPSEPFRPR